MGRFLPISPQTLKDSCGQIKAPGQFLIGSIDRSAHEVDRLSSSRPSRSFPRISRHLSMEMSSLHVTKTCTMPPQVWHPGARVSRPHASEYDPAQSGLIRRKRRRLYGTLIGAVAGRPGLYNVRWDDGALVDGCSKGQDRMKLHEDGAGRHVSSPLGRSSRVARSQPREDAGEEEGDDAEPENSDRENISGGDGDGVDGIVEGGDDDVIGPDAAAAPGQRLRDDQAAIALLAGETETVKDITWTVVEGVGELDEVSPDILQSGHDVFAPGITIEREIDAFTHMLWMSVSEMVDVINQAAVQESRGRWRWKAVSQRELGVWFGLLLGSLQFAEQGDQLWTSTYETLAQPDFRRYMSLTRFKNIRTHVVTTMAKYEAQDTDVWWRLRGGVERFNANRRALLRTVPVCVLDETMSAWRPRTTKGGGLPHISYVIRKPEPLGTEFKTAADPATGIMLALEIQEGKTAMDAKRARSGDTLIPSTSCVARLVSEIPPAPLGLRRIIVGDAWFTNVGTAVEVARRKPVDRGNATVTEHEMSDAQDAGGSVAATAHWNDYYVGVLKNGHARYPKAYIKQALHGRASGTQVVLTATVDGIELVAVGWKQNRESNLYFIMTRGVCSTRPDPSKPHIQRWMDANGNAADREIPRPRVASLYFEGNNVIDVHNQHRQGTLALEKKWHTQDCWFRLFTTLVGMCTIDALMMFKCCKPRIEEGRTRTLTFAAVLAKQLLDNRWECESEGASNATPSQMPPPPPRLSGNAEVLQRPQSAPARTRIHDGDRMCALVEIEDEYGRRDGDKRKTCHVCWEVHRKNVKTRWMCTCLEKGVCGPNTGRGCFDIHAGNRRRGSAPEYSEESGDAAPQGTRRARERG